ISRSDREGSGVSGVIDKRSDWGRKANDVLDRIVAFRVTYAPSPATSRLQPLVFSLSLIALARAGCSNTLRRVRKITSRSVDARAIRTFTPVFAGYGVRRAPRSEPGTGFAHPHRILRR